MILLHGWVQTSLRARLACLLAVYRSYIVKPRRERLQAIIRWGGALLELAHFRQGKEAYEMIEQAKTQATLLSFVVCTLAGLLTKCVVVGLGKVQAGAQNQP